MKNGRYKTGDNRIRGIINIRNKIKFFISKWIPEDDRGWILREQERFTKKGIKTVIIENGWGMIALVYKYKKDYPEMEIRRKL